MAFQKWADKDPDDVLDYTLTWAEQMSIDTDTIASYTATVEEIEDDDSPLVVMTSPGHQIDFDDTTTLVWLSGGTAGNIYEVLNRIVTAEGRQYDHTRTVKIKEH